MTSNPGTSSTENSFSSPKWYQRCGSVGKMIGTYGIGGLLLYSLIHFGSLLLLFSAILAGVDVFSLAKSYGLNLHIGESVGGLFALFLLCVAANKIIAPFHLGLTLILAPRYAPSMSKSLKSLWRG